MDFQHKRLDIKYYARKKGDNSWKPSGQNGNWTATEDWDWLDILLEVEIALRLQMAILQPIQTVHSWSVSPEMVDASCLSIVLHCRFSVLADCGQSMSLGIHGSWIVVSWGYLSRTWRY